MPGGTGGEAVYAEPVNEISITKAARVALNAFMLLFIFSFSYLLVLTGYG
jgi:hypothetical protein